MSNDKPLTRQAVLNRIADEEAEKNAAANAEAFMEAHPECWRVRENLETITDWMLAHNLQPTVVNFETAFAYCSQAGLMLEPTDADKTRQSAGVKKIWSAKEIDDLDSVTFKRLLATDPDFKRQVDAQDAPLYSCSQIVRTTRAHSLGERV